MLLPNAAATMVATARRDRLAGVRSVFIVGSLVGSVVFFRNKVKIYLFLWYCKIFFKKITGRPILFSGSQNHAGGCQTQNLLRETTKSPVGRDSIAVKRVGGVRRLP